MLCCESGYKECEREYERGKLGERPFYDAIFIGFLKSDDKHTYVPVLAYKSVGIWGVRDDLSLHPSVYCDSLFVMAKFIPGNTSDVMGSAVSFTAPNQYTFLSIIPTSYVFSDVRILRKSACVSSSV